MSAPSVTVDVGEFSRALSGVSSVIETKGNIPILSNVLVSQHGGTVRLAGTDLDKEVRLPIAPADFEGDMATTANAAHLQGIFRNLDSGAQARLSLTENRWLIVVSGGSRFQLPTLPADDFPPTKDVDDSVTLTFIGSEILDAFQRLSHAQNTEEARYYLCGIFMHPDQDDPGSVRLAATDGYQLMTAAKLSANLASPAELPGVIIPSGLVSTLCRLWEKLDASDEVTMEVNKDFITSRFGDWQVTGRLVDGQYPNYQRLLEGEFTGTATVDCEQLIAAVTRTMLLSSKKTKAVRCSFTKDKLSLTLRDALKGQVDEELPISYDGEDFLIGLNGKFMVDMARAIPGGTAELFLHTPADIVLWKSLIADCGIVGGIMPMSLGK